MAQLQKARSEAADTRARVEDEFHTWTLPSHPTPSSQNGRDIFLSFFGCAEWHVGSQFPDQGSIRQPLH